MVITSTPRLTSIVVVFQLILQLVLIHFSSTAVLASDIPQQPSSSVTISPSSITTATAKTPNNSLQSSESNEIVTNNSSPSTMSSNSHENEKKLPTSKIRFLFSDVDGTLVHYPDKEEGNSQDTEPSSSSSSSNNSIINLPPSSTGLQGVISSRTLSLCRDLRRNCGVKVVLVSGMRTATLLKRLPFLPKADAYASEAGGRIFYPVDLNSFEKGNDNGYDGIVVQPVSYDGANEAGGSANDDLAPFGLREDMAWRKRMELMDAAGKDGYKGMDIDAQGSSQTKEAPIVTIAEREGKLWEFARTLLDRGFVIDSKGYSACFRINRKQQSSDRITDEEFDRLSNMALPPGLASSTNLGCVDFYPEDSGKKNCCAYLVNSMHDKTSSAQEEQNESLTLSENAVCMCDDDNDLEMALACSLAYLPTVTSSSMAKTAKENQEKITVTEDTSKGLIETTATDEALRIILNRVKGDDGKNTDET